MKVFFSLISFFIKPTNLNQKSVITSHPIVCTFYFTYCLKFKTSFMSCATVENSLRERGKLKMFKSIPQLRNLRTVLQKKEEKIHFM